MLAYLAVAVGGLVGTGLRLACDLAFPHADGELPVETLIVNLVGAFALGWLVGGLWTRPGTPTWLKAGLGSGVIGSFTTLSAVMASLLVLTREGECVARRRCTSLVSVVGGLAARGGRPADRVAHRAPPDADRDHGCR